jgi:dTDP-4-dehydrorhamnose 3,5-epimerase-like enzyme
LNIDWQLSNAPAISAKDAQGNVLVNAECFA